MTVQLFRYQIRLKTPVTIGPQTLTTREGLLLFRESSGVGHWAEAAPLPGYSRETLPQVINAAIAGEWSKYPSLEFAYDGLVDPPVEATVSVSALLWGDSESILAQAKQLGQQPVTRIKLKVGRNRLADDIALTNTVAGLLREDQRLRLDANRAWSLPQAREFATGVSRSRIEYVEEPIQNPRDLEAMAADDGLPYALDESLRDGIPLSEFPSAAACVVKPTVIGPSAIDQLSKTNLPLVFSASFESPVGLAHIAALSARYAPAIPVGLDTYRWLDDPKPPLTFDHGQLQVKFPLSLPSDDLHEIST